MKTHIHKTLLAAAAFLGTAYLANAQSTSLGVGNTNFGNFSLASGGFNTIFGGFGNHALGWSNTIGTGSFNLLAGLQNVTAGNFNFATGLGNQPAGAFNIFGGQNNIGGGNQNLVFGSFLSTGGLAGSVMLSDANPLGLRTSVARFTNVTPDTFNGVFNGGYFLFTNDGQGANPNAGLFVFPSAANTALASNPAFVGINTNAPVAGVALDVVGGAIQVGSTFIVQPRPNNTGVNNLFIGSNAGLGNTTGIQNTFVGGNAGASNTTGGGNAFFGYQAGLNNTTANSVTFIGNFAGLGNTTGSNNVFVGAGAGEGNTTAGQNVAIGTTALLTQSFNNGGTAWNSDNVAVGHDALLSNQPTSTAVGVANTAVGSRSLRANTTGFDNSAVGFESLLANTTGSSNTSVGKRALLVNTTGTANVAVGHVALNSVTTGSSNIAIGRGAGLSLSTGSSNIYIGDSIIVGAAEANTIRIGNGNQSQTFISGISGVIVAGTGVVVGATGQLGVAASSRRFKDDIAPMEDASKALYALNPVSFRYKKDLDPAGTAQFGLIAEEVDRVAPDLVVRDKEGKILTVRYEAVNAMLLNEFLREHRRGIEKDAAIGALEKSNAELEARLSRIEKLLQSTK